ncbi:uncharacterized protein LOC106156348 [Lingula anatina]|uniref:Uncharacterized protein LOC106156348 n=1 Tax=Lingula anatina TaxID=7574 RepID=A0A1S3HLN9_LINAN|nr:uncharacterized protein LOC106156348 [Lingula anatina]|eukprot:XP_013387015.1 uncharacterized protein LOC106156348 [Lingula anatina]
MASQKVYFILVTVLVILVSVLYQKEHDGDIELLNKAVVLQAGRPTVFNFISNMDKYSQWFPEVGKIEAYDPSPLDIGKQYKETGQFPAWGDIEYNLVITGFSPPEYFSFTSGSWMLLHIEMLLIYEKDDQTRLEWKLLSNRRSYLFQYTMAPIVRLFYEGRVRQALWNLKYTFRSR